MAEGQHCSVVGLVGIIVQISLGVLSFSVLVVKRHCQKPKRPWKVWAFDTSKQVISQLVAHFINLSISVALTYEDQNSDSCIWYFTTNILDNTLGVAMCVVSLRLLQKQFMKRNKIFLVSGFYYTIKNAQNQEIQLQQSGEENSQLTGRIIDINYKAWLLQLALWNVIVILAKVQLFVMEYLLRNQLETASNFLLGWIEAYPNLQIVLVIVVVPVIMNGFAFWIQDNFLKKRNIDQEMERIQRQKEKKQQDETIEKSKKQMEMKKQIELNE